MSNVVPPILKTRFTQSTRLLVVLMMVLMMVLVVVLVVVLAVELVVDRFELQSVQLVSMEVVRLKSF